MSKRSADGGALGLEERALGLVLGQLDRTVVGGGRFSTATQLLQQIGPCDVERHVRVEVE